MPTSVLVPNANLLKVRLQDSKESEKKPAPRTGPEADPSSYLVAGARREIVPSGLSSLLVNMKVVEILGAAHESARTGRRVKLK